MLPCFMEIDYRIGSKRLKIVTRDNDTNYTSKFDIEENGKNVQTGEITSNEYEQAAENHFNLFDELSILIES